MDDEKAQALCQLLNCEADEVGWSSRGNLFDGPNGEEYFILTDDEANIEAKAAQQRDLWCCDVKGILNFLDLPAELAPFLEKANEEMCESATPLWEKLLGDRLDEFVKACISERGRGNILSAHNGREETEKVDGVTFYLYRQN